MDDNNSRKLLQQLHEELNHLQTVDENSSDLLKDIDGDIHALLERSGEQTEPCTLPSIGRMEQAVDHFEVTHPELTTLISKLFNS